MERQKIQYVSVKPNQFDNVAPGTTARCSLAPGNQYYGLEMEISGATLAQIERVRVKINGTVRREYKGAELQAINVYDGYHPFANVADPLVPSGTLAGCGIMYLPFVRADLKMPDNEVLTGLTVGVPGPDGRIINTLVIEIDFAAGSTPEMEIFADIAAPDPNGPGAILSAVREVRTIPGAAEVDFHSFVTPGAPDATRQFINRHFLFMDPAKIDNVEVRRNNTSIFDKSVLRNTLDAERLPSRRRILSDFFPIDPTIRGYGGNVWDVRAASDYRVRIKANAAEPIVTTITEFIGEL